MVPLVAYERELELMREMILGIAGEMGLEDGEDFRIGTMIELPRACLVAGRIAEHAEFFSFGTNDLTQTGLGFSRDDIEGSILPTYIADKIVDVSPFESIDEDGLGQLIRLGVRARARDAARSCTSASAASTAATRGRSGSSTARGSTT